jgi:single-strand DNA-binding protein
MMAGSLNKVMLIGNVGRDPEIRSTQGGQRIANLSIATSESWKDRNTGERKERTEWARVVVFNENLVEIIEKYVHKGSKIMVEGQLQTRKWADQAGVERYSTEVVLTQYRGQVILLGDAGSGSRPPPAESADDYGHESTKTAGGDYAARHDNPGTGRAADLNDEIPF